MVCRVVNVGGMRTIVCGPRAPRRFCACGAVARFQCDWKVPGRRSGTCDAYVCDTCSTRPEPDKDLCATHAATWEAWKARQPVRL
jgi:hypothetical protein